MDDREIKEIEEALDAFQRELSTGSDRAVAIVAAAHLDDMLAGLLKRAMLVVTDKEDKQFFRGTGPLATFSARINVAYRLGLISSGERRSLHIVRDIRNDFAHVVSAAGFRERTIADRCRSIEISEDTVLPRSIPMPSEQGKPPPLPTLSKADSADPRAVFIEAVHWLAHCMVGRNVQASRPTSPSDFLHAHEPAELLLADMGSIFTDFKAIQAQIEQMRADAAPLTGPEADKILSELDALEARSRQPARRDTFDALAFANQQVKAAHEARRAQNTPGIQTDGPG